MNKYPSSGIVLYGISLGKQPVGDQCPLTSSLGEFPGYWAGSRILGYRPCWCPSPFPFLPSIPRCFPFTLTSPPLIFFLFFFLQPTYFFPFLFLPRHWISFVFLLYDRRIFTHSIDPSLVDGEFRGLGMSLIPNVVV